MNKGGRPRGVWSGPKTFEIYENQIIELIANGFKQHEIPEKIPRLSVELVNKYVDRIKEKWNAKNAPHLIHLWHEKKNKSQ